MNQENPLSQAEKKFLLEIARKTIETYAREGRRPELPSPEEVSENLCSRRGAFVTLHKRGMLRGCIGVFAGRGPLYQTVSEMAIASGWEDPRFPPLDASELDEIEIEISVLSPLQPARPEEIEVGKHGIYITKGFSRGVLLPQVAVEYGWDRETFLAQTCLKAGLHPDAWKEPDTKIEIFTAEVFSEKDFK